MFKGCQTIYNLHGDRVFDAEWDPLELYLTLTCGDDGFWNGKKVLDIGANTCGLSIEIARRGAEVVALEPDPYNVTYALSKSIVDEIVEKEKLKLTVIKAGLFQAHDYKGFDAVLCLGLLYHFRYPQLILDYLSTLEMEWLFLSTQVHPGDELVLVNRVEPSIKFPENFFNPSIILTGWHPTRPLLAKMLYCSKFDDVQSLTDQPYVFPQKQPGLTNSAYFRARRVGIVDPLIAMSEFYPR
jgi:SAM-dependent methyltransferase